MFFLRLVIYFSWWIHPISVAWILALTSPWKFRFEDSLIGYPNASKITMNWKNIHFLQTIMLGTHVEFAFVDETHWFLPRCRSMRHQPRPCRKSWKAGRNWGLFFLRSFVDWEGGEKQGTVATNILYCTGVIKLPVLGESNNTNVL